MNFTAHTTIAVATVLAGAGFLLALFAPHVSSAQFTTGTVVNPDTSWCVTNPNTLETTIGTWNPDTCHNPGPAGEQSNLPTGGSGGGDNIAQDLLQQLSKLPLDKLVGALGGAGGKPHPACVAEVQRRMARKPPIPPPPNPPYPCFETTVSNGQAFVITGTCIVMECKGLSGPGLDGKPAGFSDPLASGIADIMKGITQSLLQKLLGGSGESGGGGGGATYGSESTAFGGANSDYSIPGFGTTNTITSASGGGNTFDSINRLLDGLSVEDMGVAQQTTRTTSSSGGETSNSTQNLLNTISQTGNTSGTITRSSAPTAPRHLFTLTTEEGSGESAFTAVPRNAGGEGEGKSSGFFGTLADNTVGRVVSAVERVCTARPWANSALSRVMPDGAFDGLCARLVGHASETDFSPVSGDNGNAVGDTFNTVSETQNVSSLSEPGIRCEPSVVRAGTPVAISWSCGTASLAATAGFSTTRASAGTTVAPEQTSMYGIRCSDGFESMCTVRVVDPQVALWSEPEKVRLGARAKVFWNSQDMDSCIVTGSDFQQTGVYGGASTVALTESAIFTAVCTAATGEEITEQIVVDLAL